MRLCQGRSVTTTDADLPEHVALNRTYWDGQAAEYVAPGTRAWGEDEITWGIWHIPEASVRTLPQLDGIDVIELGCGTAYVSSWLARRGARVVGIDNSPAQLQTARALQAEHGIDFPLLLANAEHVPYADASFDLAVSEYGASLWCDPYAWIPEAARLLRRGGRLVFLTNSVLVTMCAGWDEDAPASAELKLPQFGMHRMYWKEGVQSVDYHLPHGVMLQLLRDSGFDVLALHELQAPEGATTRYAWVTSEWAHKWPSEEMWVAEKR